MEVVAVFFAGDDVCFMHGHGLLTEVWFVEEVGDGGELGDEFCLVVIICVLDGVF